MSGKKFDKMKGFYQLLKNYADSGKTFKREDISSHTGYALDTVNTYIRKKLRDLYIKELEGKKLKTLNFQNITEEEFIEHMSQVSERVSSRNTDSLASKLIKRALDAFIVAIEVYNRPSLENRVEVFAILLINAWELLLKSELKKRNGYSSIFYADSDKSLSLRDVLKRMYKDNDPIRRNIETLEDLRDQAIHLLIPELQRDISRIFQASVLNFVTCYSEWTGKHPFSGKSVGMLSLIIEGPEIEIVKISHDYGDETAKKVQDFLQKFEKTEKEIDSISFSLPIEYKLVLTKKEDQSDLILSKGSIGKTGIIIEVAKDIKKLYPLRTKAVIELVNSKLKTRKINMFDFIAIINKHKIKSDEKLHYFFEQTGTHLYSINLVDLILKKINEKKDWIEDARNFWRRELTKKKTNAN